MVRWTWDFYESIYFIAPTHTGLGIWVVSVFPAYLTNLTVCRNAGADVTAVDNRGQTLWNHISFCPGEVQTQAKGLMTRQKKKAAASKPAPAKD